MGKNVEQCQKRVPNLGEHSRTLAYKVNRRTHCFPTRLCTRDLKLFLHPLHHVLWRCHGARSISGPLSTMFTMPLVGSASLLRPFLLLFLFRLLYEVSVRRKQSARIHSLSMSRKTYCMYFSSSESFAFVGGPCCLSCLPPPMNGAAPANMVVRVAIASYKGSVSSSHVSIGSVRVSTSHRLREIGCQGENLALQTYPVGAYALSEDLVLHDHVYGCLRVCWVLVMCKLLSRKWS